MAIETTFNPVRILEVELSAPIPAIAPIPECDYRSAHVLVRLHHAPLGLINLSLSEGGLTADAFASGIWGDLADAINLHLAADGLPPVTALSASGIAGAENPACRAAVDAVIQKADLVSIIIPTHDRADALPKCIDSLLAQRYPNYEIIIVDDAPSSEATHELYERAYRSNPKIRYIRDHRPNAAWARNAGLAASRSAYVAFVDDDVRVDAWWLAELMLGFQSGPDVVCVTTLLLPVEIETEAQYWFEQYGGFNKGYEPRLYDMKANRPESPIFPYSAGVFGTGGGVAFRADWLRSVGGWDPDLPAGEDLSIFFESIMTGHQLAYAPGAIGWHRHRLGYDQLRRQIYSYGWGLSAFITRSIVHDPRRLPGLLWRLPQGMAYMFSNKSRKNSRKSTDYPAELTTLERRGLLLGPWKYISYRWRNRKLHQQAPSANYGDAGAQHAS
jgi:glycosyltransferase involved in cell wall biosynthesis